MQRRCDPDPPVTTKEQRCLWCGYPTQKSSRRVRIEAEPFQGEWCTANCAVSFFPAFRREIGAHQYIRALQNACGVADDVEWGPAPEPHDFEWWTPGGRSRAEFLASCRVISMRPDPVVRDPVEQVRQGYSLLELFERAAPERSSAAKRRKLAVGGQGQNQNRQHQEGK